MAIAYFDVRYYRIPNALSLGAWGLGLSVLLIKHSSLIGAPISSALMAAGFAALVTLPAYLLKKLGAGDVKMLVAIGLLTSFEVTATCFVTAAALGVGMVVLWASAPLWSNLLPMQLINGSSAFGKWLSTPIRKRKMPYGALFSIGLLTGLTREGLWK